MYPGYITDVKGIIVGHSQSEKGMTGCTAVICEKGAVGGVDVRGSAPGTRETDLLKPDKLVDRIHAVVLSGGSAFGLEAASGVMRYLEEQGIGFDVGVAKVPIVASAVIFDLNIGDHRIRPDLNMGYDAARSASAEEGRQGNAGCGLGATVGKAFGPEHAMKSGLGSASLKSGELIVSAIVSANSFGDIFDYETGRQLAGVYDYEKREMLNTYEIMKREGRVLGFPMRNTTIGVVAANAVLTKAEANKIAAMAHNGFARSINPVHTMMDGDTIFTMATNEIKADINLVGTMAAEAVSRAVTNAVVYAKSCHGLIACCDI
ncbi:MAG TPA: P1 family peptidase [Bacillota bacterium]|nr:P1 family peptidase [Clostridiaceae bacterium]HNR04263.1 P1 family peptidase [Bacillota bacterium]HNT03911.1 P1 family peptidase [Bacillota bacterium]HPX69878.1 P1 family peptidase [Bacillota bacterium]HQA66326.1 P1 family peptidase [Bacillota bacterium]